MPVLDKLNLAGKVAVVTGAGRGLGRAMALALAHAGADLVVTARTRAQIEETADMVRGKGRVCIWVTRAVIPHMREQGSGKIINVASGFGLRAGRNNFMYTSAKAGLINFTRSITMT